MLIDDLVPEAESERVKLLSFVGDASYAQRRKEKNKWITLDLDCFLTAIVSISIAGVVMSQWYSTVVHVIMTLNDVRIFNVITPSTIDMLADVTQ